MVSCFFQGLSFNAYFVSRATSSMLLRQNTNVFAINDEIAAAESKGDVMSSRILIVDEDEATTAGSAHASAGRPRSVEAPR